MGTKVGKIVVVVVGFKADKENSVHYAKIHNATAETVGLSLWKAYQKGADFASVRFIREAEQL
jgi:hypothetical protein